MKVIVCCSSSLQTNLLLQLWPAVLALVVRTQFCSALISNQVFRLSVSQPLHVLC